MINTPGSKNIIIDKKYKSFKLSTNSSSELYTHPHVKTKFCASASNEYFILLKLKYTITI